jgi:hypothetical protein
VLYAGAIRTTHASDGAEVRAADAVVVAAPIGETRHKLPKLDDVADKLVTWTRAQLAANQHPVVVVDHALDGLEVAAKLVAAGLAVTATKSVRDAAGLLGDAVPALRAPGKEPSVIVRTEADRLRQPDAVSALVSARAVDPQQGWDATFAWPFVASRDQLLAWIDQSRAKQVFVTGACAETIVAALGARGHVLGPPQQMALFSS